MVYIIVYTKGDNKMDTAKLFKNGRSQAVRLPKAYSFSAKEVYIKKIDGVVILIPKDKDTWQPLIDSLNKFSNDFFDFRRDQGTFDKRAPIK
jgi:antitoxin VapB